MRQPAFASVASAKRVSTEIRQRVLSARQHRQKNLQNQLNVAMKMNAVNLIFVDNLPNVHMLVYWSSFASLGINERESSTENVAQTTGYCFVEIWEQCQWTATIDQFTCRRITCLANEISCIEFAISRTESKTATKGQNTKRTERSHQAFERFGCGKVSCQLYPAIFYTKVF